ncbi:MAG: FeoB-associated Cys-rich membrane protein [Thermodesulfobacteriota bacterium]
MSKVSVFLILCAAVLYLIRKVYKSLKSEEITCCSDGCSACPSNKGCGTDRSDQSTENNFRQIF